MADWTLLEKRLGLKFRDPLLLQQALVHRSYLNEMPDSGLESNERLEFLGDAVLGLVVGSKLFTDYPEHSEGQLTELRVALVRRETLARVAKSLSLGDFLFLGRGEASAGGKGRVSNLSAAYEAVVGAVFVDGGMDKARRFIVRSLTSEVAALPEGARHPGRPEVAAAGAAAGPLPEGACVQGRAGRGARPFEGVYRSGLGRQEGVGRGTGKEQAAGRERSGSPGAG